MEVLGSEFADVQLLKAVCSFIKFIKLPFGGGLVEVGEALASEHRAPSRKKQFEPFNYKLAGMCLPADVQPQYSEGQSSIDGGLCLLLIHPKNRKCSLPLPHQSPGIE